MKFLVSLFAIILPILIFAQTPTALPDKGAPVLVTEPVTSPKPVAPKAVVASVATPTPAPEAVKVQVPEPAAPPEWAQNLIMTAEKLPVIGPIISKILVYLGILGAIMTSFVAFLLTTLRLLSGVLNIAGLTNFADKVTLFRDGKIMYWIKYLSMFNAKKPVPAPPTTPA